MAEHGGSHLESHYLGGWDRSARNLRPVLGKHQLPDQNARPCLKRKEIKLRKGYCVGPNICLNSSGSEGVEGA